MTSKAMKNLLNDFRIAVRMLALAKTSDERAFRVREYRKAEKKLLIRLDNLYERHYRLEAIDKEAYLKSLETA